MQSSYAIIREKQGNKVYIHQCPTVATALWFQNRPLYPPESVNPNSLK